MRPPFWVKRIIARVEAGTNGYLAQIGWFESRARRMALNADRKAIPWFTYPAVRLFEDRADSSWRILEFGAGMGTIWWSGISANVLSLEHDETWFDQISEKSSARIIRTSAESPSEYVEPARGTGPYDVVIVDGIFRQECLDAAPELTNERGIIVLDDAQRDEYRAAIQSLLLKGYRVLDLHGPQPVSKHPGCTAIFYRDGNVLGI